MSPHSFRRRGRRHQNPPTDRVDRSPKAPATPLVFPDCSACGQPVRDLSSALTHRETGKPAHFDCILKELRETNPLGPQEKLCYLGGGVFGVLTWRSEGNPGSFVIKRRIPYEDHAAPHEWKKTLQANGQALTGMPEMGRGQGAPEGAT